MMTDHQGALNVKQMNEWFWSNSNKHKQSLWQQTMCLSFTQWKCHFEKLIDIYLIYSLYKLETIATPEVQSCRITQANREPKSTSSHEPTSSQPRVK